MQDREAQFLDALYLGVRDRTEFDKALQLLCGLFDTLSAALIDFDAARPEVATQASVGVFSGEALQQYQQEFATIDPAPPAFMRQPVGTAIPTYRLLPEEKRHPGAFFAEFFQPMGLEECLGGTLAASNGRFAMVGLHRAPERKPFDDDDIAKLEALMPHLSRALQLHRSFVGLEQKAGGLSEVCDRLAAGMVGLDDRGRALFVNEAARTIALKRDGLALDREGRPMAFHRTANQALIQLANDVKAGGAGGIARVPRPAGPPYMVIVAPLPLEPGVDGAARRLPYGTLYLIHDPLSRQPPMPDLIAGLFGMPIAAANMVAAMMSGEELGTYAERVGISMHTVRFHLKTAHARTGARRQAELIRIVATALRDLADHRNGRGS